MNKKIRILHLEDSFKDSELIQSVIQSGGIEHEYFLVDNEKDFIDVLETKNIDIILSDYSLPGYNGTEVLTHIAAKNAKTEIILLITPVFINKSKLAKLLSVNYQSNTNWLFG